MQIVQLVQLVQLVRLVGLGFRASRNQSTVDIRRGTIAPPSGLLGVMVASHCVVNAGSQQLAATTLALPRPNRPATTQTPAF